MKTKALIKEKGLELFNRRGVMFVTLRDVAKAMGKSYGNITYHYPNKEKLVTDLYHDMVDELQKSASGMMQGPPRLEEVLKVPGSTFDVSLRYLFLNKDYVDILRNYPTLGEEVRASNRQRKQGYLQLLKSLLQAGMLRAELEEEDLNYLMELSGAMRTFFFMQANPDEPGLKAAYVRYVNRLLYPYLSEEGRNIYNTTEATW